jgi:recombination protein RecR
MDVVRFITKVRTKKDTCSYMNDHLPQLQQLIQQLQQLPYLASKNVYRVAHHILGYSEDQLKRLLYAVEVAHRSTIKCPVCYAWKEREQNCYWCTSSRRTQNIVCVVETWHDLCAIERAGGYTGVYHVLGGVLSPLDGIEAEDLTITELVARIRNGPIEECILAMNQTLEGEATIACITRALQPYRPALRLSCLSRGIPVGSPLDMLDRLTVGKAIAERRPLS